MNDASSAEEGAGPAAVANCEDGCGDVAANKLAGAESEPGLLLRMRPQEGRGGCRLDMQWMPFQTWPRQMALGYVCRGGGARAVASDEATEWPAEDVDSVDVAPRTALGVMSFANETAGGENEWELPLLTRPRMAMEFAASFDTTVPTAVRGCCYGVRRGGEGYAGYRDASAALSAQGKMSGSRRPGQDHGTAMTRRPVSDLSAYLADTRPLPPFLTFF